MTAAAGVAELQDAVASCPAGRRLLPVAGGSKPALSVVARGDVDALDVSALRGIVAYDPAELTLTAMAATPVAEVASALGEHGQYLPFDPPLAAAGATLGGALAAGTSGPSAFRYGGVRDFVIGVRFVDGTGRLVAGGGQVVKNAAGFDFPKLMVGSIGRLGVIVQLAFKVFPRPLATTTLEFEFGGVPAAMTAVAALVRQPRELDAVDILPGGRVLIRLGGDPAALDARAGRLAGALGEPAARHDGDAETALWRAAAEFAWVPAGSALVRVALTAREVPELHASVEQAGGLMRSSLAGNVAWAAWPADAGLERLDGLLRTYGLAGIVLSGAPGPDAGDSPAPGPLLGRATGGAFGARIRRALDPFDRFVEV